MPASVVVKAGSEEGAALASVGCDVGICSRGAGVGVGGAGVAVTVGEGAGVADGVGVGSGEPPQPANNNAAAQPILTQVVFCVCHLIIEIFLPSSTGGPKLGRDRLHSCLALR